MLWVVWGKAVSRRSGGALVLGFQRLNGVDSAQQQMIGLVFVFTVIAIAQVLASCSV